MNDGYDPSELYVPRPSERTTTFVRTVRRLYGREAEPVDVSTEAERRALIATEFQERLRRDQDVVALIWGPPGSGKSTLALDLCARVDPTFTPTTLPERVAFRPDHVPGLYRRTPRFGAAWVDEAATSGLLSTQTFDPTQQLLVELISIIRMNNVALFILIPSPEDLAKSFRARRADYRFECEPRKDDGSVAAWMGRRVASRKFFMDDGRWLGFSDAREVNPVVWPDYRTSEDTFRRALWDVYYPLKVRYGETRVEEIDERMRAAVLRKSRRALRTED